MPPPGGSLCGGGLRPAWQSLLLCKLPVNFKTSEHRSDPRPGAIIETSRKFRELSDGKRISHSRFIT
eukprot:752907-Hanusia_phi.AAC.1